MRMGTRGHSQGRSCARLRDQSGDHPPILEGFVWAVKTGNFRNHIAEAKIRCRRHDAKVVASLFATWFASISFGRSDDFAARGCELPQSLSNRGAVSVA